MSEEFTDDQLSRYSRHLLLPEIDIAGQQRLKHAKVALIGAGGLGGPAAMFLAGSGVGQISIYDDDRIEISNLQRQIAFTNSDLDAQKAARLKQRISNQNPEIEVTAVCRRTSPELLDTIFSSHDLVLDCCDNFDTRFAINRASRIHQKTVVSGAAIRFEGQITVFQPRVATSPCYHCLYREEEHLTEESCRDRGVFAPLVGIIGSMQAAEAIKCLIPMGEPLTGRLLTLNSLTMTPRISRLAKDPHCPVCSGP